MYKCVKCHFEPSGRQVCDKCINNYYVNNAKSCTKCHYPVYIYGGVCKVCSDDLTKYETGYCTCSSGYTANSLYSCISCSAHCSNCNYDKVTKTTHCNRCYAGYTLNDSVEHRIYNLFLTGCAFNDYYSVENCHKNLMKYIDKDDLKEN